MPEFLYKGRTTAGEAVNGRLVAASAEAVASQLISDGITPVDIHVTKTTVDISAEWRKRLASRKPNIDDLILFSRQLYTLMRAGVPIIRALTGLADNMDNPLFAEIIRDLVVSLESGHNLAGALNRHPDIFGDLFVSMVQVGENTGQLDNALLQLSQYLEREKDTRDRIKQAMRYPTFVITAIAVAVTIINLWVIPTFAKIFEKFHAELPWQTKVLINASNFMVANWVYLLVFIIGAFFGLRYYLKTEKGKLNWDHFKLNIPLVGVILNESLLGRFATSFSMTLRSGVPLIQGLNVVARAVDNTFVEQKILNMRNGIERGDTLTNTATGTKMFTPLILQMIAVGEETGSVDEMLENVAEFYEREVDYKLKNLSSSIEPILIIVIGALVLLLALGVFLPMWDLAGVMRS